MPTVKWLTEASEDVVRHYNFLAPRNAAAAVRAVKAILRGGDALAENPRRGRVVDRTTGLRKYIIPFGKYGYALYYKIENDFVLIEMVYHGRENQPY